MKSKKIENEQTPYVRSDADELNDKDSLEIILLFEKMLGNNYSVAVSEMSNKTLYQSVFDILEETKKAGRDAFEFAFNKGWYSLEEAEETKIKEATKRFKNVMSE